jgi:glycosyltransferase involved in cell wall biosynthesis
LKILYVITRSDHGGAQVALLDLVRHLPAPYEPVVAAGENGYLQEECARSGIPFRFVPGLVQPINPFADMRALVHLRRLILKEKPALVHTHTSKAGMLGRLAAWATGTPAVFTAHTWSFDRGVARSGRWLSILMERVAAFPGGKIITVSQANTEKALRYSIAKRDDLVCIWNGIPDAPERANPGLKKPFTLVMVARMVPQKDFDTLLNAVAELRGDWKLLLVGDGPDKHRLELLSARLGLTERVHFLGNRADVPELLSQADAFVLSTNWEGLPISILEAMRAGLPVVATEVGGVNEQIAHGVNGFMTKSGDAADLRTKLQTLIESPQLMANLGAAGRLRFESDFTIDISVAKTIEIYKLIATSDDRVRLYLASEEVL